MSGPRTKVSGAMVQMVLALGQNCLGAEVSGHFGTRAEVSRVKTVLSPMCPKCIVSEMLHYKTYGPNCLGAKMSCLVWTLWHSGPNCLVGMLFSVNLQTG